MFNELRHKMEEWTISHKAVSACPSGLSFPIISSESDKDIAEWMSTIESICESKECLHVLHHIVEDQPELDKNTLPELKSKRGPWYTRQNNILITNRINKLKCSMLIAEFKKSLTGPARVYSGIRSEVQPSVVWNNLKTTIRKTITKSSNYAMAEWKDLRLINFDSVNAFTDEFRRLLEVSSDIRMEVGESPISELEKINTLFNCLEESDYIYHRIHWVQKDEFEAKNDTVEKYINGLRKDAAIKTANIREKGYINYKNTNKTFISDTESKRIPKRINIKRKIETKPNSNPIPKKSKISGIISSVANVKSFPNRPKDTKGIEAEKHKQIFRNQPKIGKKHLKCDHCQKIGHTIENCWGLHGKPTESGRLLKELSIKEDLTDEDDHYIS
jgi:hypothetical protein